MDSKQFAWCYLVMHGDANLKPSIFGGLTVVDTKAVGEKSKIPFNPNRDYRDTFLSRIKEVGVDWGKTNAPQTSTHTVFNGTFCDSTSEEHVEGTLILKDGTTQYWSSERLTCAVFDAIALINEYTMFFANTFEG